MSAPETSMGGPDRPFPTTNWTDVLAARDPASPHYRAKLDTLLRNYWRPVYVYVRTAWSKTIEDAKDLTQAFFAHFLEKGYVAHLDPEQGSFRGYLRTALKHFLVDRARAASTRRPDSPIVSLDASPRELNAIGPISPDESPDAAYDREWFNSLLDVAVEHLRQTLERDGKAVYYQVFRIYCLGPTASSLARGTTRHVERRTTLRMTRPPKAPTYRDLAATLGIRETDVRNYLTYCRRLIRQVLRERIRDYVGRDGDVDPELDQALQR